MSSGEVHGEREGTGELMEVGRGIGVGIGDGKERCQEKGKVEGC